MKLLIIFILCFSCLAGQPVIYPGGIVNSASYAGPPAVRSGIAPGSLVSLFGANLAPRIGIADSIPLPRAVAGTSVMIGEIPAALLYVSPGQINLQVPREMNVFQAAYAGTTSVVVQTAEGISNSVIILTFDASPGIFTLDGSGCGGAAALNVNSAGAVSINSPQNSISPGECLSVFGTGFFSTGNPLPAPTGEPGPDTPSRCALVRPVWDLGSDPIVLSGVPTVAAPGLIGVDQANLVVPSTIREGCAVPLHVESDFTPSQDVLISIKRGGGICVDPPSAAFGAFMQENYILRTADGISSAERIVGSVSASPGKKKPVAVLGRTPKYTYGQVGPSCNPPGYRTLSAGAIQVLDPNGLEISVAPLAAPDGVRCEQDLPAGTMR